MLEAGITKLSKTYSLLNKATTKIMGQNETFLIIKMSNNNTAFMYKNNVYKIIFIYT